MADLIERLRERAEKRGGDPLLAEAAAVLEAAQMGLRYALRAWAPADEIDWREAEIVEAAEYVIGYAIEELYND